MAGQRARRGARRLGRGTGAGGRIVEVLGRSRVWVPLPNGGRARQSGTRSADGGDRRRGLCPGLQLRAGVPAVRRRPYVLHRRPGPGVRPRPAAADRHRGQPRRHGRRPAAAARGGRTVPDGPYAARRPGERRPGPALRAGLAGRPGGLPRRRRAEFSGAGLVLTARRALASVEGDTPALFVGVQLVLLGTRHAREAALAALGRALGAVPVRWPVKLILLDMAQDPVADWMLERVRPFYSRG